MPEGGGSPSTLIDWNRLSEREGADARSVGARGLPLALAGAVQAQQLPVFRAGVELLEVDVSVVDDQGEPITDLSGSEFSVSVDGEPRRIAAAQFIDLRPATTASRAASAVASDFSYTANSATARGRLIMLAVDRESISFGEGRQVMRAGGDFLDMLGPTDQVALITVPPPGPSVDFTTDHQLVRERLEMEVGVGSSDHATLPIEGFDAMGLTEAEGVLAQDALGMQVMRRVCGAAADPACEQTLRQEAWAVVMDMGDRPRTSQSVWALERLLRGLREIEGRKFIVWISERLVTAYGSELFR